MCEEHATSKDTVIYVFLTCINESGDFFHVVLVVYSPSISHSLNHTHIYTLPVETTKLRTQLFISRQQQQLGVQYPRTFQYIDNGANLPIRG